MENKQKKQNRKIRSFYLNSRVLELLEEFKKAGYKQGFILEQALQDYYNKLKQQNRI